MLTTSIRKQKTRHQPADVASSFILKSFQLLEDQKFTDIVDWNEEGTSIVIKDPLEFGQTVLPTYFKHGNITSFIRQLNMYNFRKRRTPAFDLVYHHEQFRRGEKHLLKFIKRKVQDNNLASIQKAIEVLKSKQANQQSEPSTDCEDTVLLRKLNQDAFARITSLEKTVEELVVQNDRLQRQACEQTKKEDLLMAFVSNIMNKTGTTKEHLYEILDNQFKLPPLDLKDNTPKMGTLDLSQGTTRVFMRTNTAMNVENFLNFSDSSKSTELTFSPQDKQSFDVNRPNSEAVSYETNGWRHQLEQKAGENQLARKSCGAYDNEFEHQRKMLKTESTLNIGKYPSFLSRGIPSSDNQETQDIKLEDYNNSTAGMYSSMNDFLNDGLGFLNFD